MEIWGESIFSSLALLLCFFVLHGVFSLFQSSLAFVFSVGTPWCILELYLYICTFTVWWSKMTNVVPKPGWQSPWIRRTLHTSSCIDLPRCWVMMMMKLKMLILLMRMKMMRMAVNIQMRGKPSTLVFAYQPGVAPYGDKPMWVQIFLLEKPMWCGSKYSCFLHKATFRLIVTYFFLI